MTEMLNLADIDKIIRDFYANPHDLTKQASARSVPPIDHESEVMIMGQDDDPARLLPERAALLG